MAPAANADQASLGVLITGQVVYNGAPCSGASVTIKYGNQSYQQTTGSDGTFNNTFSLSPGSDAKITATYSDISKSSGITPSYDGEQFAIDFDLTPPASPTSASTPTPTASASPELTPTPTPTASIPPGASSNTSPTASPTASATPSSGGSSGSSTQGGNGASGGNPNTGSASSTAKAKTTGAPAVSDPSAAGWDLPGGSLLYIIIGIAGVLVVIGAAAFFLLRRH